MHVLICFSINRFMGLLRYRTVERAIGGCVGLFDGLCKAILGYVRPNKTKKSSGTPGGATSLWGGGVSPKVPAIPPCISPLHALETSSEPSEAGIKTKKN